MRFCSHFLKMVICVTLMFNVALAQETTADQAKQEILTMYEGWIQMYLKGDTTQFENFYPKDHKSLSIWDGKIVETNHETTYKKITNLFKNNVITQFEFTEEPIIFVSKNGQMAGTVVTGIFESVNKEDNKKWHSSFSEIELLEKKNGKWLTTVSTGAYIPARDSVIVDADILADYSGKYQSKATGNVYEVTARGNNLIQKRGEQVSVYIPQSDCSFFIKESAHSIVFGRDKNGKVSHYTWVMDHQSTTVKKIE